MAVTDAGAAVHMAPLLIRTARVRMRDASYKDDSDCDDGFHGFPLKWRQDQAAVLAYPSSHFPSTVPRMWKLSRMGSCDGFSGWSHWRPSSFL